MQNDPISRLAFIVRYARHTSQADIAVKTASCNLM